MTVCKTFTRLPLVNGNHYKRSEVIANLTGNENTAATYYDPSRDELRTFFDENSPDWTNTYQNGELTFEHNPIVQLEETPPWERTKIRHVFLRRKAETGTYEYLGTAIDEETLPSNTAAITGKKYTIQ